MALFGRSQERNVVQAKVYTGATPLEVKGESNYQHNLEAIAGPRTEDGYDLPVDAVLVREPDNHYDKNAITVHATRTGGASGQASLVGYIARADAARLAPVIDR